MSQPNGSSQRIRLILFGSLCADYPGVEDHFEVLRCDDSASLARIGEEAGASVLLVELMLLSQEERAILTRLIDRLDTLLAMAISSATDDDACEQLLRRGFVGVLRRGESSKTLVLAVHSVVDGQLWFPRKTMSRILKKLLVANDLNHLTSREMEILRLIGSDLNNQQIADKLFVARETVRWHVRGLYSKLGVKDRQSAKEYLRSMYGAAKPISVKSEIRPDRSRHSSTAS